MAPPSSPARRLTGRSLLRRRSLRGRRRGWPPLRRRGLAARRGRGGRAFFGCGLGRRRGSGTAAAARAWPPSLAGRPRGRGSASSARLRGWRPWPAWQRRLRPATATASTATAFAVRRPWCTLRGFAAFAALPARPRRLLGRAHARDGEIDAALGGHEALHDQGDRLADLHELASAARRRIGHQAQRHVADHVVDAHVGAVRRVVIDDGVDAGAGRMALDEGEERQQIVDRGAAPGLRLGGSRAAWRPSVRARRHRASRPRPPRPRPPFAGASAGRHFDRPQRRRGGGDFGTGIGRLASGLPTRTVPSSAANGPGRDRPDACGRALALGLGRHLAAERAANGQPLDEHPADVRHGLAADEATFVEQPVVLRVELLVAVVGEDVGVDLVRDAEHECIAATDGAGRRRHQLVVADRLVELGDLFGVDAVAEGGVDDHRDERRRVFRHVGEDRFVELFETGAVRPSVARFDPSTTT